MPAQGCKLLIATIATLVLTAGAASAQQPIQPLAPQLRLTQQGADGDGTVDAQQVDVAHNSQLNEFLVVWENRVTGDAEIFGRRLSANGTPIGSAFQISGVASDVPNFDAREPAVAYDPEGDRYAVVFSRDDSIDGEREIFLQLVDADGRLVNFANVAVASPVDVSNIGNNDLATQIASSPDVVYRGDTDGNAATPDAFVVVYDGDETDNENNIFLTARNAASGALLLGFDRNVSAMTATGDGFDPTLTVVPGTEDLAVAWEGSTTGTDTEIFVRRMPGTLPDDEGTQLQRTTTGAATGNAFDASITANPDASQLLFAYRADEVDGHFEIHVQRLNLSLGQVGTNDQQVSSAGLSPGPPNLEAFGSPAVDYNRPLGRYLVAWIGNDEGRPGFANDEEEITGTVLDANGTELAPQDFPISRMGAQNDDAPLPSDVAVAANGQTRRWLPVWSSDDAQAPLADNEFELFGRQVGENFDVDGDGSSVPDDCDDGNAGIRPGAVDVFDNGVDEDCVGGDAQNPDRDGDGATRPGDCDDGNPAIRPGAAEVVNNEVDENCDRVFGRRIVDVDIEREFSVFARHTRVTKLRVKKLRPGMRIQLRCKGRKCPKKLRKGKVRRVEVTASGTRSFTRLFEKARLKPKAVVDVRVFQPSAIARVDKFVMRKAKLPRRKQQCIPPGVTRPRKAC